MKNVATPLLMSILTCGLVVTAWGASVWQETKVKRVTRVTKPDFSEIDRDLIYFANVFRDGLVGQPPQDLAAVAGTTVDTPDRSLANQSGLPSGADRTSEVKWSPLISADTIENEIKAIQVQLAADITTPVRFRSDYIKSHRGFSMLSMLFAIILHYENDVRWKSDAGAAQVSFWQAAANARVGTPQAFESCRRRLDVLTDLIRGGKFVGDEKPQEDFDWSSVVDRNPLMHRLETSREILKTSSSSQSEFERQREAIKHEGELVAAIALVLTQEYMNDADDEGYQQHANQMLQFARNLSQAVETNQFSSVQQAVNQINQSCDNCHSDWK